MGRTVQAKQTIGDSLPAFTAGRELFVTSSLKQDLFPRMVTATIAMTGILVMVFILAFLVKESLPVLQAASLSEILLGKAWQPVASTPKFGMATLIVGSLSTTALALSMAIPIGIALAFFISEVAPAQLREALKPAIEIFGFLPSVVLGFIGMSVIAPYLQMNFELLSGLNMFNASALLGIMALPLIVTMSEDALASVPHSHRDASYALGATRLETMTKVILPGALPGIMQTCLLGAMRALGETMVVLMAAGGAAIIPESIMDPVRPLTSTIAAEMGETPIGSTHYHALFFMGLMLLIATLLINASAMWIVKRNELKQ